MERGVVIWRVLSGDGGVISLALGVVLSETCVCASSNEPCYWLRIMGNIMDDANLTLRFNSMGKF